MRVAVNQLEPNQQFDPNVQGGGAALTSQDQAMGLFDQGRVAFSQGDYPTAIGLTDQAIALSPNDRVMHEFKGLCLFAQGNYQQAAAVIYAVLSGGPGFDWTTVANLYGNVDAYTQQLRALEAFRNQNPQAPEARLLLAYHYLLQGYQDAAARELQALARLQPQDALAKQLLASIAPAASGEPAPPPGLANQGQPVTTNLPQSAPVQTGPAGQPAQAAPVDPAYVVGSWKAAGPTGSPIGMRLGNDKTFEWTFTQQDKPQSFSGTYTLAGNVLVLQAAGPGSLVGQITPQSDNQMNFKLMGNNPADPGLNFQR
jgi:tetratricopeptide (TPR) repeat protein